MRSVAAPTSAGDILRLAHIQDLTAGVALSTSVCDCEWFRVPIFVFDVRFQVGDSSTARCRLHFDLGSDFTSPTGRRRVGDCCFVATSKNTIFKFDRRSRRVGSDVTDVPKKTKMVCGRKLGTDASATGRRRASRRPFQNRHYQNSLSNPT